MILPAHLSAMVVHQLSLPAVENSSEYLHQHHRVSSTNYIEPGKNNITFTPRIEAAISSQQVINNGQSHLAIANLNSIPRRNSSLSTDEASLFFAPGLSKVKKETDNSGDNSNSDTLLEAECQLELDVIDRVVDTAIAVKSEGLFPQFIVAMIYQRDIVQKKSDIPNINITKRMMVVAPFGAKNEMGAEVGAIDVPAHVTLVITPILHQPQIINLPAQLVSGFYYHSDDWMAIKLSKLFDINNDAIKQSSNGVFRICASGFRTELIGNAVIVDSVHNDCHLQRELSLHIPGAKKTWIGERLPTMEKPLLKNTCSAY